MVGDGDAVGIAAEILQDVLGSAEGWFGVDDPVFAEERTQPGREELGMGERCEFSGQVQLTALEGRLQAGDELATKHASQYSNGKEEAWVGSNPAAVIKRESAGGDDTVDMGMKLEFLVPGMEHTEEADVGSQMGGITRDFQQGFGAGPEQQTVDEFPVLKGQRSQLRRQSENDMDVGRGQQFTATRLDPAFTRTGLTLGAVPITAAVVGDGGTMSAAGALIDMATEGSGATARDGQQDLEVSPTEPRTVARDEVCSCAANDVGHFKLWPTHLLLLGRPTFLQHQRIQWTGSGMQVPLREVEIASGFFQIVMA